MPSVDALILYTDDANPFMREWLEPMGLGGAMKVSNVPPTAQLRPTPCEGSTAEQAKARG